MDRDKFVEAGLAGARWCVDRYDELYVGGAAVYENPLVAAWFAGMGGTSCCWVPFVRADACGEHDLVEWSSGRLETMVEVKSWYRAPFDQACLVWDADLDKMIGCRIPNAVFALWVSHCASGWNDARDVRWRTALRSWAGQRSLDPLYEPDKTIDGRDAATSLWIWTLRRLPDAASRGA